LRCRAIEAAVLSPPLLLLIGLAIVGGRIQVAGWAIESAAHDAARAASIARTKADARVRALAAANATLQQNGLRGTAKLESLRWFAVCSR